MPQTYSCTVAGDTATLHLQTGQWPTCNGRDHLDIHDNTVGQVYFFSAGIKVNFTLHCCSVWVWHNGEANFKKSQWEPVLFSKCPSYIIWPFFAIRSYKTPQCSQEKSHSFKTNFSIEQSKVSLKSISQYPCSVRLLSSVSRYKTDNIWYKIDRLSNWQLRSLTGAQENKTSSLRAGSRFAIFRQFTVVPNSHRSHTYQQRSGKQRWNNRAEV